MEAFADGQGADVPVLIDSNRDEARLFLIAPGTIDFVDDATLVAAAGAYGLGPDGMEVYRANRPDASPGDLLAAIVTDWFFGIPGLRVAESRAATGTTWVYRFDHPDPAANHRLGACHAVEIPFVFDTITRDEIHPSSATCHPRPWPIVRTACGSRSSQTANRAGRRTPPKPEPRLY